MRILDNDSNKKIDDITLYLKKRELIQLRSYIDQLLEDPQLQHSHLSSSDYQKEITLCIYDEENLEGFNERSKKLILDDE